MLTHFYVDAYGVIPIYVLRYVDFSMTYITMRTYCMVNKQLV
jgi:hypothetical protein